MPDIVMLTGLDRKLIEEGIIDPEYTGEYYIVHEKMKSFRAGTGKYFSTDDLAGGEDFLRKMLEELEKEGHPRGKLTNFLRCGLAHLCYDFIEFTYELIPEEEIIQRSVESMVNRNYHVAVLAPKEKLPVKKTPRKKTAAH
jgi:hypothetical protein